MPPVLSFSDLDGELATSAGLGSNWLAPACERPHRKYFQSCPTQAELTMLIARPHSLGQDRGQIDAHLDRCVSCQQAYAMLGGYDLNPR